MCSYTCSRLPLLAASSPKYRVPPSASPPAALASGMPSGGSDTLVAQGSWAFVASGIYIWLCLIASGGRSSKKKKKGSGSIKDSRRGREDDFGASLWNTPSEALLDLHISNDNSCKNADNRSSFDESNENTATYCARARRRIVNAENEITSVNSRLNN